MNEYKGFDIKNKLEEELRDFINKNSQDDCSELIYKYNLEFLLFDLINHNDKRYLEIEKRIQAHIEDALIIENEVSELSHEFERESLKMVNLKGVTLVKDIYDGDYSKRYFGDIDILVSYEESYRALDILRKRGYYFQKNKNEISEAVISECKEIVKNNRIHFPELEVERIRSDNSIIKLELDLHISLIHKHDLKLSLTDDIIVRSYKDEDCCNCNVLDVNDQIIFLAHHLSKEYFRNDVRWCITGSRKININEGFNLRLLHDIALYIEKYKDIIDWNEIKNRIKMLNIANDFVLILNLISYIYKSLQSFIPTYEYMDIMSLDQKYGKFYSITYALNNEKKLLLKSKNEFSKYIIKETVSQGKKLYAKKKYFIYQEIKKEVVGSFICENKKENTMLSMQYEKIDNDLVFIFERNIDISEISITIGTDKFNLLTKAYINKFLIRIGEKSLELRNASMMLKLNGLIEVDGNKIVVNIPMAFIELNVVEGVLLDIDNPNYHFVSNNKEYVKKYEFDEGNYPFSPRLMYVMCF